MSATFELEKKHQAGAVRTLAYLSLGSGHCEKQKPKSPMKRLPKMSPMKIPNHKSTLMWSVARIHSSQKAPPNPKPIIL